MQGDTYIFFGIVGSGKGTQVSLLMEALKNRDGREIIYAYPGNEYRNIISNTSQTSSIVKDLLSAGHLQPDFLTNAIFVNMIYKDISPEKHLIADGFPRRIAQADCFMDAMKFFGRENVKIINLKVSHEEVISRMKKRGRHDDTDEGIERRFVEYAENVVPTLEYLKSKAGYEFFEINGEQSVEDVHKDIIKALGI